MLSMIISKRNENTRIDNRVFRIGQVVRANAETEYVGKKGTVKEIRTGNDRDTDNPNADIYVQIGYDEVILDASMLDIISH